MNKRQKKKNYKKIHGHNPSISKDYVRIGELFMKGFAESLKAMFGVAKRAMELGMESIKTMPETEFYERLQNLNVEQQVIALEIRKRALQDGQTSNRGHERD